MIIRKYNPNKDFLFILNSEKTFIETHGESVNIKSDYLKKYWNHNGLNIYILEHKGVQIGYVIAVYNGKHYELNTIYMKNGYRNKGYMFKLLSFLLKDISSNEKIIAEHLSGDIAAQKTLIKCGFVYQKVEKNYYDNNKDSLVYEMNLKDL